MDVDNEPIVCSECFHDEGLRLDAQRLGVADSTDCPSCCKKSGFKLSRDQPASLAHRFFVWGSLRRAEYGAAPLIQFNTQQQTSITVSAWLESDLQLIQEKLGVGFFRYGPRLWMLGEVYPLKDLQNPSSNSAVIKRILQEYPARNLTSETTFYRLRKAPSSPTDISEFDSPPTNLAGKGRLDSNGFPVMYASPDLQVCIHECRVTAEDDLFIATLRAVLPLRLLDLTVLLVNEKVTEFESLDMAVHMLFLAAPHSYPIARSIALAAHSEGFDGIMYPSYFSLLRTGDMPFETVYGLSARRIPSLQRYEQAKAVPNLAIFGRPIEAKKVEVCCINRLILHQVEYRVHFGPVGIN